MTNPDEIPALPGLIFAAILCLILWAQHRNIYRSKE